MRFDGPRGYAITAERKDPLFTIDLSNPALPKQAGELEMPGWIFHMEPRGDRLIGFGYDDTDASQANLAVSLFDVSDLDEADDAQARLVRLGLEPAAGGSGPHPQGRAGARRSGAHPRSVRELRPLE